MIRYQGENIEFSLSIEQVLETDIPTWHGIQVIAYLYTYTCASNHIVKFKRDEDVSAGYNALTLSSSSTLTGTIPSVETKKMLGALYLDLYLIGVGDVNNQIRHFNTGVNIQSTPITQET